MNDNKSDTQQDDMNIFTNDFSREVFETKYRYGNETIQDMRKRVAKTIASVEEDSRKWESRFEDLLEDFKFIPGGRILSNAGVELRGTTMINCYVSGFQGEDRDSMDSILSELKRQAFILKSEGGYGFCVDTLRPRYSFISGIGSESPGAVKMLDMWDTQSDVITAGSGKKSGHSKAKSGIRKGAQMVTMSIWHPDIEEFITAKQTPGRLTKFNMSVLVTDEFMEAVRENMEWKLEFPDIEKARGIYKAKWDGNLAKWKEAGLPVKTFKTYENANELWEIITKSTYNRNEPGILFVDRMNYWNNLHYDEYISSTNPCVIEGTLVNTPYGYRKVETLRTGDLISTVLGKEPIEEIEVHEHTDVYLVKFSNGIEQTVTAAHQYHAQKEGSNSKYYVPTRLDMLEVGDRIRIEPTEMDYSHDEELYYDGAKAGIILGDGCYTKDTHQIKIAINTEDVDFNDRIKTIFGNDLFIKDSFGEGKSGYFIFGKDKLDPHEFGVTENKSYEKHVDYDYCTGSYVIGLLDGLIATDGNINLKSNHPAIRFNTTSKQLATDIYNLLTSIGCYSTITNSFDESGTIDGRKIQRRHLKYTVNVSGASVKKYFNQSHLYLIHPEKYNKLKSAILQCSLAGNNGYAKIESIEYVGDAKTYDLYCKESDTWITSGLVQRGCGEQILPVGGVCLLGSINLTQFVLDSGEGWDYDKLGKVIPDAVRFMDNVNDITYVPLAEQMRNLKDKRRIGLGIMGYASALVMMKVRYGSEKALKLTDDLMSFITNSAYSSSAMLAKEKGAFPLYDSDKYMQSNFITATLSDDTKNLILKHGIRNSHLTSVQPTGNTSSFANVVSGGLEPIFRPEYVRTMIIEHWPDNLPSLSDVDFSSKKFECSDKSFEWKWITEGDENILRCELESEEDSIVYKYDKNRGLTKESVVTDYGVAWLREKDDYDSDAEYMVDTAKLTIDDHVDTMKVIAKYIDSAMSKTINISNDYSFDDFKGVYDKIYDSGVIKGCTTYREGTMTSVLSALDQVTGDGRPDEISRTFAPKRPKKLDCDIHHMTVAGEKWIVFVGLYGGEDTPREEKHPYEVFAFKRNGIQISPKVKDGELVKVKQRNHYTRYDLVLDAVTIEDVCSHFKTGGESALTRMISTALRHGADIDYIYEQLMKAEGTIVSFSKAIARAIKKYVKEAPEEVCPNCGGEGTIVMSEGCMKCTNCGTSKC